MLHLLLRDGFRNPFVCFIRNPYLLPRRPPAQPSCGTNTPTRTTTLSENDALILSVILLILFLSVIGLVIGLIYFMSPSINEMSSYTVTSTTVDPFNISSSQLTAAWNISIHIQNYETDEDMYFDRVQSSIYYGSYLLSQVSIPSFSVKSHCHKTLHDRLMAHLKSLDVDVAESMIRERLLRGAVDFQVELLARTKYIVFLSGWMTFKISCDNVTVGFPAMHDVGPGVMLGPPRKCNVLVDGKTNKRG